MASLVEFKIINTELHASYYLNKNPWKVTLKNEFQKIYRYCLVCGKDRFPDTWAKVNEFYNKELCHNFCMHKLGNIYDFVPIKFLLFSLKDWSKLKTCIVGIEVLPSIIMVSVSARFNGHEVSIDQLDTLPIDQRIEIVGQYNLDRYKKYYTACMILRQRGARRFMMTVATPVEFSNISTHETRVFFLNLNPWMVTKSNATKKYYRYCLECGSDRFKELWHSVKAFEPGTSEIACGLNCAKRLIADKHKFIPSHFFYISFDDWNKMVGVLVGLESLPSKVCVVANDRVYPAGVPSEAIPKIKELESMPVADRLKELQHYNTHDVDEKYALNNYMKQCAAIYNRGVQGFNPEIVEAPKTV